MTQHSHFPFCDRAVFRRPGKRLEGAAPTTGAERRPRRSVIEHRDRRVDRPRRQERGDDALARRGGGRSNIFKEGSFT